MVSPWLHCILPVPVDELVRNTLDVHCQRAGLDFDELGLVPVEMHRWFDACSLKREESWVLRVDAHMEVNAAAGRRAVLGYDEGVLESMDCEFSLFQF